MGSCPTVVVKFKHGVVSRGSKGPLGLVLVPTLGGVHEQRLAVLVHSVDIGVALHQKLGHVQVPRGDRVHQGGLAIVVVLVDRALGLDEECDTFHSGELGGCGGDHQGCAPVLIAGSNASLRPLAVQQRPQLSWLHRLGVGKHLAVMHDHSGRRGAATALQTLLHILELLGVVLVQALKMIRQKHSSLPQQNLTNFKMPRLGRQHHRGKHISRGSVHWTL
mmetsp:Transcript_57422/g.132352  ORF Transcript_57422/g.132352 Transcript_57422/m.132352 type:complete len:220 (-) Transcript_57422:910-1569(-)